MSVRYRVLGKRIEDWTALELELFIFIVYFVYCVLYRISHFVSGTKHPKMRKNVIYE